jgi:membrane protease YdiL (CAAX protease family)
MLVAGVALLLHLVPGTILQLINLRWGLLATQTLFLLTPVLVAIHHLNLDPRAILPLHAPGLRMITGTLLATLALNHLLTAEAAWREPWLPTPEPFRLMFADLFVYRGAFDFAILLTLFAVVPAICEEVLFRGFLQSGILGAGRRAAAGITITALIFAAFHLDPWRFPEVLALGIFLGYVRWSSGSLIPAMLAHALNNAVSICLAAWGTDLYDSPSLLPWSLLVGGPLLAAGLLLIASAPTGQRPVRVL